MPGEGASSPASEPAMQAKYDDLARGYRQAGKPLALTEDEMDASLAKLESSLSGLSSADLGPRSEPPPALDGPTTAEIGEWSFDQIHSVPYDALPSLGYAFLMAHDEISSSKIDKTKLWHFICEVAARYHARPFHNFRHAVDVLLAASALLKMVRKNHASLGDDPTLVGALLVGAIVHDVDHPGLMNGYLKATGHGLAAEGYAPTAHDEKYGSGFRDDFVDASAIGILERHHAAMAVTLLDRPELDFLSSHPERSKFVSYMREFVLATDVSTTMAAVEALDALVAEGESGGGDAPAQQPDAPQVMRLLIRRPTSRTRRGPTRLRAVGRSGDGRVLPPGRCREGPRPSVLDELRPRDRQGEWLPGGLHHLPRRPLVQGAGEVCAQLQVCVDQMEKNLKHYKGE